MTSSTQTARFQALARLLSSGARAGHLLENALQLVREELAINRAAILLAEGNKFKTVYSAGVPAIITQQAQLSSTEGIGLHLLQTGRILRYEDSDETARKEMALFGVQAALPVIGRGKLQGFMLLDAHLTGEPLTNAELCDVFFLLEKLGGIIFEERAHSETLCAFVEILAHRIGNAAVAITTRLQLASEGKGAELDQAATESLTRIGQTTAQLRKMAQDHRVKGSGITEAINCTVKTIYQATPNTVDRV